MTTPTDGQAAAETPSSEAEDLQAVQDEGLTEGGEQGAADDGGEVAPEPEIELAEIDHAGKKYQLPRELKDSFLMHADYTRKTQEVGEEKRTLTSEREAFTKAQEAHRANIAQVGQIVALNQQLEGYAKVDWMKFHTDDPLEAPKHFANYQQLKDQRDQLGRNLEHSLGEQDRKRQLEAQQSRARRIDDGQRELARDIKGWSPEAAAKLVEYAKSSGLSQADIAEFETNPRMVKLLHQAWLGNQLINKQKTAAANAARTASGAQEPKPLTQVSKGRASASPSTGLADNLSIEEWTKRRNEQLRKKSA